MNLHCANGQHGSIYCRRNEAATAVESGATEGATDSKPKVRRCGKNADSQPKARKCSNQIKSNPQVRKQAHSKPKLPDTLPIAPDAACQVLASSDCCLAASCSDPPEWIRIRQDMFQADLESEIVPLISAKIRLPRWIVAPLRLARIRPLWLQHHASNLKMHCCMICNIASTEHPSAAGDVERHHRQKPKRRRRLCKCALFIQT